jgi:hypothetical protein
MAAFNNAPIRSPRTYRLFWMWWPQSRVVDLDWIRIQWIFGSGFRIRIRIQWQEKACRCRSSYSQWCLVAAYTDISLQSSGNFFLKVVTVSAKRPKNSIKRGKFCWNIFWRIESCKLAIRKKFKIGSGSGLSKNAGSGSASNQSGSTTLP